jgi:hypothetical protein
MDRWSRRRRLARPRRTVNPLAPESSYARVPCRPLGPRIRRARAGRR